MPPTRRLPSFQQEIIRTALPTVNPLLSTPPTKPESSDWKGAVIVTCYWFFAIFVLIFLSRDCWKNFMILDEDGPHEDIELELNPAPNSGAA